jgi:hypothetical protein
MNISVFSGGLPSQDPNLATSDPSADNSGIPQIRVTPHFLLAGHAQGHRHFGSELAPPRLPRQDLRSVLSVTET